MGDRPPLTGSDPPEGFPQTWQLIWESTQIGMLLFDPPEAIRSINPALKTLTPTASEAESVQDLLTPWSQQRLAEEALPTTARFGHWHGEIGLNGPDGGIPVGLHLIGSCLSGRATACPWIAFIQTAGWDGEYRPEDPAPRRIPVPLPGETRLVDPGEILLLEADRHYTHLHTTGGHLLASQTLAAFEQALATEPFVRVHRSYLANLRQLRSLRREKSQHYVRIDGLPQHEVPVSRRRLPRVEALLGLRSGAAAH